MDIKAKTKEVLSDLLKVKIDELKDDVALQESIGVDSTEMVEISVGLKKEFGVPLLDNEIKKTHTLNDIVKILKIKGVNS